MQTVFISQLGKIKYDEAWKLQEEIFAEVVQRKIENREKPEKEHGIPRHYFLLCEHEPVITLGKNAQAENVLMNEHFLKTHGIEKFDINRGGDVTFHGPGQIVGYPILDLDYFFTDIGKYLRNLEEVIIRTLVVYGVHGERMAGATGVWLDVDKPAQARKICAIGIRCSRWVTMHGFALNINTNLEYFKYIIPCGITDKQVTSLERETGEKQNMEEVKTLLIKNFAEVFQCEMKETKLQNLTQ